MVAVLAGGCFWGVEDLVRKLPGVLATEVGYTGGTTKGPTYKDVCTGTTGHAEALQIEFDESKLSYKDLLRFFFRIHDPTSLNRQGGDIGSQYRSAIFFADQAQRADALAVIAEVNAAQFWKRPVVTTLEPQGPFYSAEEYHQDYLQKNPGGYTCHFYRESLE
jgi:methionine-S-sulfoxide reductase